ncbi:MAG: hypothetical protein ACIALR_09335 [Blastopirellula sp. JB062]
MLIANCPHCHDPIRIPGAADASSRVRCPWCEESYLLADVFERLPPLVEVLEGPGSATEVAMTDGDDEYQLAGAAIPDFQFKESAGAGSSVPPMAKIEGRSASTVRRPAKPTSNPIWEAVKVVGGGALGILIAMFAVMWISGDDKFHLIPFLPSYAYFAVPEQLWTDDMRTAAGKPEDEAPDATSDETASQPLRVNKEPQTNEAPLEDEASVSTAVENGMSSLGAAFNEAKNRGDAPPPQLGQSDFVPPPEPPIVVKPSPAVDADLAAEFSEVTGEIGPIGAEIPAEEEPEPVKRREPNISLDPEDK